MPSKSFAPAEALITAREKEKKCASPSGNRTPVSCVTGRDTYHYTNEDWLIGKTEKCSLDPLEGGREGEIGASKEMGQYCYNKIKAVISNCFALKLKAKKSLLPRTGFEPVTYGFLA